MLRFCLSCASTKANWGLNKESNSNVLTLGIFKDSIGILRGTAGGSHLFLSDGGSINGLCRQKTNDIVRFCWLKLKQYKETGGNCAHKES